jgi:hypothetical protein
MSHPPDLGTSARQEAQRHVVALSILCAYHLPISYATSTTADTRLARLKLYLPFHVHHRASTIPSVGVIKGGL